MVAFFALISDPGRVLGKVRHVGSPSCTRNSARTPVSAPTPPGFIVLSAGARAPGVVPPAGGSPPSTLSPVPGRSRPGSWSRGIASTGPDRCARRRRPPRREDGCGPPRSRAGRTPDLDGAGSRDGSDTSGHGAGSAHAPTQGTTGGQASTTEPSAGHPEHVDLSPRWRRAQDGGPSIRTRPNAEGQQQPAGKERTAGGSTSCRYAPEAGAPSDTPPHTDRQTTPV